MEPTAAVPLNEGLNISFASEPGFLSLSVWERSSVSRQASCGAHFLLCHTGDPEHRGPGYQAGEIHEQIHAGHGAENGPRRFDDDQKEDDGGKSVHGSALAGPEGTALLNSGCTSWGF